MRARHFESGLTAIDCAKRYWIECGSQSMKPLSSVCSPFSRSYRFVIEFHAPSNRPESENVLNTAKNDPSGATHEVEEQPAPVVDVSNLWRGRHWQWNSSSCRRSRCFSMDAVASNSALAERDSPKRWISEWVENVQQSQMRSTSLKEKSEIVVSALNTLCRDSPLRERALSVFFNCRFAVVNLFTDIPFPNWFCRINGFEGNGTPFSLHFQISIFWRVSPLCLLRKRCFPLGDQVAKTISLKIVIDDCR